MAPRLRRILPAAAALLGAALLIGSLHALSRSMIYPGGRVALPSEPELARRFPAARLLRYQTADGLALAGALFQQAGPADPPRPVLVHFHGNGESAAQNLPFAAGLFERGLDVFLPEYRGYGGMPGRPTEDGLYADGEAALDALLAAGVAPERIVLLGRSLGSGVAAEMALRRPVGRLILVSPFTSMTDMGRLIAGPLARFAVPDRYDTLAKLPRLRLPVVIVHGTRDQVVPVRMGRALAAALPGARYIEIPEADHNLIPGLEEILVREALAAPGT
ncbi:MAG TPA: alpha/beta hydrolase [Thermoanaerobaculia bacterium]|nr:alpha/beta hydrolase [Thermoanaerobaculia bacterium]